jgi:hypothetical protein
LIHTYRVFKMLHGNGVWPRSANHACCSNRNSNYVQPGVPPEEAGAFQFIYPMGV